MLLYATTSAKMHGYDRNPIHRAFPFGTAWTVANLNFHILPVWGKFAVCVQFTEDSCVRQLHIANIIHLEKLPWKNVAQLGARQRDWASGHIHAFTKGKI